ncbi:hypothetical protein HK405_015341, partial [Cladochytrium tenue]
PARHNVAYSSELANIETLPGSATALRHDLSHPGRPRRGSPAQADHAAGRRAVRRLFAAAAAPAELGGRRRPHILRVRSRRHGSAPPPPPGALAPLALTQLWHAAAAPWRRAGLGRGDDGAGAASVRGDPWRVPAATAATMTAWGASAAAAAAASVDALLRVAARVSLVELSGSAEPGQLRSAVEAAAEAAADNGQLQQQVDLTPGVLAGLAKSFATRSAFAVTAFAKGLLKWWFRVPIKLFRPSVVNPLIVLNKMAEAEGKKVSATYVRSVVKEEGFHLISKNMIPLLVCNSVVGAVLFNVYLSSSAALDALATTKAERAAAAAAAAASTDDDDDARAPLTVLDRRHLHPFVAGGLAGAAQSVLATPIDNVTRRVNPDEMLERRGEGVVRLAVRAVREAMPPALGPLPRRASGGGVNWESVQRDLINLEARCRFFWEGWTLNCVKDGL